MSMFQSILIAIGVLLYVGGFSYVMMAGPYYWLMPIWPLVYAGAFIIILVWCFPVWDKWIEKHDAKKK